MTRNLFLAAVLCVACSGVEAPAPASVGDPLPAGSPLLPARVRRLTNAEYQRSVQALIEVEPAVVDGLVPDLRQGWFSRNDAQVVDPLQASAIDDNARRLAAQVAARTPELLPCAGTGSTECLRTFLQDLALRAFRRPASEDELTRLQVVFEAGASGGDWAGGVELVVATVFAAPSALYLSELGDREVRAGVVVLTQYEIASQLAYLISGAPPDAALLGAAARGELADPGERESHARRLLASSDTRFQYRTFVREWLGIDALRSKAKDSELFPDFYERRETMLAETDALVDEVMARRGASVAALLEAGLLEQASFLATHSHEAASSPVKRGVVVLERLACKDLPRPGELGIEVVPPPPDPSKSTRELLEAHVADPACRSCHDAIDGAGFAFEGFDAVGAPRAVDNGQAIDASGHIVLDGSDHSFIGSAELAAVLGSSEEVRRCYARQALRFAAAASDPALEDAFVAAGSDESLLETLIRFVRNELFVLRRLP